jgi:hypothetical protein
MWEESNALDLSVLLRPGAGRAPAFAAASVGQAGPPGHPPMQLIERGGGTNSGSPM